MTVSCRPTPDGPRLRTHTSGCVSATCEGCTPCPGDAENGAPAHCQARPGRCARHTPRGVLACPKCVRRGRVDLTMIEHLSALMMPAALAGGVNSEAAMLAGPAPHPAVLTERQEFIRQAVELYLPAGQQPAALAAIPAADPLHPYAVLGGWMMRTRNTFTAYPMTAADPLTVSMAASYLRRMLPTIAGAESGDYPTMLKDLRHCRAHLESVLHNSWAPEKGAPCPQCSSDGNRGPALVKAYADDDATGAHDTWSCSRCHASWTEAEYRLKVWARYVQHADRLPATQIETEYRVKQGTLRKWVHEGKVRRRGRDTNGRQLYDVADVLEQRDRREVPA